MGICIENTEKFESRLQITIFVLFLFIKFVNQSIITLKQTV